MKKKLFGIIIGFAIALSPALVSVTTANAAGLVPDCGKIIKTQEKDSKGNPVLDKNNQPVMTSSMADPCDFDDLMTLINTIINFLLFVLATPLVIIILCYAGFKLITSGGSSESITKAKHMIKNVIFGYIIALAAWLIIHTIFSTLGVDQCLTWLGKEIPECKTTAK